jgi:hypothetical protein
MAGKPVLLTNQNKLELTIPKEAVFTKDFPRHDIIFIRFKKTNSTPPEIGFFPVCR